MASGNLTAPVLFALQSKCGDELLDLIDSEFVEEGDLQRAIELVKAGGGVAAAKQLACEEADKVCLVSLVCLSCRCTCQLSIMRAGPGLCMYHVALIHRHDSCRGNRSHSSLACVMLCL